MLKSIKKLIALVSAAAMLIPAIPVNAETPVELTPVGATYIDEANPGENFSSAGVLYANQAKISGDMFAGKDVDVQAALLKFDASEYIGRIRSATLEISSQCTAAGKNSNVHLTSLGTDWDAATITWNDQEQIKPVVEIATIGNADSNGNTFNYDVTDELRNDADGIVAYGLYTETARQQQITSAKLKLTVSDTVLTTTTITVRCVNEEGEVIAEYPVPDLYVGDSYQATAEMLADKTYNGKNYTLASDAVTKIDSIQENDVLEIKFKELFQKVLVYETFDALTDTWGFSTSTGVSILGGALQLCATNGTLATDEKVFDDTVTGESALEISFKWKTEVDLNATGGRSSNFMLADSDGNVFFGLSGSSNRDQSKIEYIQQIAYGYSSDYGTYTKLGNPDKNFYTITLKVDFRSKKMSGTIADSTGKNVATFNDVAINANNLSKLTATNVESIAPMDIDDFKILEGKKQEVTFVVTNNEGAAVEGATVEVAGESVTTNAEGKATLRLLSSATYTATITASLYKTENKEFSVGETDLEVPVTIYSAGETDDEIVDYVLGEIDIANGTTCVANGSQYTVTGDFDLPASPDSSVSLSWSVADDNPIATGDKEQLTIAGSKAIPMPMQDKGGKVALRVSATYNTVTKTKDFVLDLDSYLNAIVTSIQNAIKSDAVYPFDDKTGTYGMSGMYSLTALASTPISYDLYLPTQVAGISDSSISQTWSVNSPYMTLNSSTGQAAIALSDNDEHTVTISRTVNYTKNGKVLVSEKADYPVKVKFDKAEVKANVDGWASAYAATVDADTTSTKYKDAYNRVYNALFSAYQIKLDAACEANFSNMPAEGADISNGISNLKMSETETMFGSVIEWSTNSSYAAVSKSAKKITVTTSSFSGTKDVQVTATLSSTGYSQTAAKTFNYKITGTKSTSSGSSPSGGGGTTTTYYPPSTLPTPTPSATKAPYEDAFDDVASVESWAGESIKKMYEKGIIAGKGDGKFAPNDNVTRGEFVKMIVGTFGLSSMPSEYKGFSDVPAGNWCFSYVEIACAAGVVNGYDDGSFGLNDNITRQDMAVMVVRAAVAANKTIADAGASADFGDNDQIADYASVSVERLVKAGIINGIDGNFEPVSNATRAQAAKILATFID